MMVFARINLGIGYELETSRNSPHPAKATSPHPLRGVGRVRGASVQTTVGFISEVYFGN